MIGRRNSSFFEWNDRTCRIKAYDNDYRVANHPATTFKKMCLFYEAGQMTDIVLKAGSTTIRTHKLVLASVSEYFEAMFSSDLLESRASEVELHEVDGDSLKLLVSFAYTGIIEIKEHTVENILATAVLLRFSDVIDACSVFLKNQLDANNCLGIAAFAESRNCSDLRKAAVEYAEEHFIEVLSSQEFLLMPVKELEEYLSSENINVTSEEMVYKGVISWIEHDPENRKQYLEKLLGLVKLPLLTASFLVDEVVPNISQESAASLIIEALQYHALPERRSKFPSKRVTPRKSTIGQLYSVGGCVKTEDLRNWSSTIETYSPRTNSWSHVSTLPNRRLQSGAAALGHKLFVVGGRDGLKTLSTIDFLDLDSNTWLNISPMSTSRHGLGVTTIEQGPLYAVGGHDGWSYLNSVERWDPDTGEWSYVKPMQCARSTAGVGVLYNRLFVVGGRDGVACLRSVEAYDPLSDKWKTCAPMSKRRGGVAVAVLNGFLYALGGYDMPSPSTDARYSCVERYDPKMDAWQFVGSMAFGRDGIGAGILENNIFAVGGYDGETYCAIVEAYDPFSDTWTEMAPLSFGRAGSCVVSLKR